MRRSMRSWRPDGRSTGIDGNESRVDGEADRAGTPVPDNDLWIAALALEHDLTLITRDRHFERIAQLPRESE